MKLKQLFHYTLIISCLLQFTLPFHAVYAAPVDESQAEQSAIFGDKFLLCTAEGFKWVSWKELQGSEHQPKEHQDYECALCFAQSSFGKGITTNADIIVPNSQGTQSVAQHGFIAPQSSTAKQHQSRAPPFIIIL